MLNYQRIYLWENRMIDPGWPEVTIPESPGCPEVVGSFMIPIDEHFFKVATPSNIHFKVCPMVDGLSSCLHCFVFKFTWFIWNVFIL